MSLFIIVGGGRSTSLIVSIDGGIVGEINEFSTSDIGGIKSMAF